MEMQIIIFSTSFMIMVLYQQSLDSNVCATFELLYLEASSLEHIVMTHDIHYDKSYCSYLLRAADFYMTTCCMYCLTLGQTAEASQYSAVFTNQPFYSQRTHRHQTGTAEGIFCILAPELRRKNNRKQKSHRIPMLGMEQYDLDNLRKWTTKRFLNLFSSKCISISETVSTLSSNGKDSFIQIKLVLFAFYTQE